MDKKHAIITGGAKGIGASCAKLFSERGYAVTLLDVDNQAGSALAKELGPSALFLDADVSQSKAVSDGVTRATSQFGEVDVLINNAGIVQYGTVTQTTDEMWDEILTINLKSHFLCARACIPSMLKKDMA